VLTPPTLHTDTALTFAVLLEMAQDAPMPMSKAAQAGVCFTSLRAYFRPKHMLLSDFLPRQDVPVEWIPAERRDAMEDDGSGPGRGHTAASQDSTIAPIEGIRFGLLGVSTLNLFLHMLRN
jgi:hypothetical protein